jgi:hypothetical protein
MEIDSKTGQEALTMVTHMDNFEDMVRKGLHRYCDRTSSCGSL